MDKSTRMDDADKFIPPWKSNDVKVIGATVLLAITNNLELTNYFIMLYIIKCI